MEEILDKAQLEEYRARWEAANKFEEEELRTMSFAERWRRFNLIMQLAAEMGLKEETNEEELEEVRRRWKKLKGLD